jgi:hypothetical protein
MGYVSNLLLNEIKSFLDNYPNEVKALREDLKRLYDKKLRGSWGKPEIWAVKLAYNQVNNSLEKFKFAYLGHYGDLPKDVMEKLKVVIDELEDVSCYMIEHFEDDIVSVDDNLTLDDVLPFLLRYSS